MSNLLVYFLFKWKACCTTLIENYIFQKIDDDPKNSMDVANKHPHLIAMGKKKEETIEIKCFYIMFEGEQILVRNKLFIMSTIYSIFVSFNLLIFNPRFHLISTSLLYSIYSSNYIKFFI